MALTDLKVKSIKPQTKTKKYFDGGGFFLEVTPTGSKLWRLKYRFQGVEKLISLGKYPEISLKDARNRKEDAKRLVANGINPMDQRREEKAASIESNQNHFEKVAMEWLTKQNKVWADNHSTRISQRLERDVFPYIGKIPVDAITPPDLLKVLHRIEGREAYETAHRTRGNFGQIFRYAIATGRLSSDPSRDLRGALTQVKGDHLPAVTEPKEVAELLRSIDGYRGSPIVSTALKLAPLVFVRPGELRQAEWAHINMETGEWRFAVSKTKTDHIVPLSRQALEILYEIRPLTGGGRFVFPSARTNDRAMSDNAVLAALRSLGIPSDKMCGHGFRAMARTLLDEVLGFPPHLIEHQLAHAVRDALGRAYNRTQHLPERKKMMQAWADYLFELKKEK
jgi:integrase